MTTQTETTLKMFHSPHGHTAFKHNWSVQIKSGFRDHNFTSQPFAGFEFLSGNAVEAFAAEIFRRTINAFSPAFPEQAHPPMHCCSFATPAIIRKVGCRRRDHRLPGWGKASSVTGKPRYFWADRPFH
jgi:hypothetical protein